MSSLMNPDMTIVQLDSTKKDVTFIASTFRNDEILIGHSNGDIYLWKFFEAICGYLDDNVPVVYIYCIDQFEFLSVNRRGVIKIWNFFTGHVKKRIALAWWKPDHFVMLPDNLLAFSKFHWGKSQSVEVWDIETGACAHEGLHLYKNAFGMPLDITTAGYLLVASRKGRELYIWDISKTSRNLIGKTKTDSFFSVAALPTNEIVTAARIIVIYKLTQCGDIIKSKVIYHKNIIDLIIPVAGYKFLTVDRSRNNAGVMKLWYCSSQRHDKLGIGRYTGCPRHVSSWYNLIFSYKEDNLFIKHYDRGTFEFSRNLAEIRKNVRILAQAQRTFTSLFITLPTEILIKIAVMTAHDMNVYEKNVSREFAYSHFCRPYFCPKFLKQIDEMYDFFFELQRTKMRLKI